MRNRFNQGIKCVALMGVVLGLAISVIAFGSDMSIAEDGMAAPEIQTQTNAAEQQSEPTRYGEHFEESLTIKTADGARHDFSIELALTPHDQEKGLMFRQSMPAMHGMLFVFGSEMQRSFWMKNTLIPLDIIFLERDGRIQHIHSMAKPQDLSMITSGKRSYAVLELNGGTAAKLGINAGDIVHHTVFRNNNLQ